jgi:hypothetical protein
MQPTEEELQEAIETADGLFNYITSLLSDELKIGLI